MTTRGTDGRVGVAVAIALAVLVASSLRVSGEGRSELEASDAAVAQGDFIGAAVHARGAARAYVPLAAHMEQGLAKLRAIAEKCERRGDTESALFAWRALLSADSAARPFSSADDRTRGDAEASVIRLSAELLATGRAEAGGRRAVRAERAAVAPEQVPRTAWAALIVAGACLAWGAGFRLSSRGWVSDGRPVPRELRLAVGTALAGLVAWLTGLLFG